MLVTIKKRESRIREMEKEKKDEKEINSSITLCGDGVRAYRMFREGKLRVDGSTDNGACDRSLFGRRRSKDSSGLQEV